MISVGFANTILASLENTAVQLHIGDPGPAGRFMVAQGAGRRQVVFTNPVHGQVFNAEPIAWLGVMAMERYTHFTAWDGDMLLFSGTVACEVVFAGDNVVVPVGDLTAFFSPCD